MNFSSLESGENRIDPRVFHESSPGPKIEGERWRDRWWNRCINTLFLTIGFPGMPLRFSRRDVVDPWKQPIPVVVSRLTRNVPFSRRRRGGEEIERTKPQLCWTLEEGKRVNHLVRRRRMPIILMLVLLVCYRALFLGEVSLEFFS